MTTVKYIISNFAWIILISIIIGSLFVVFKDFNFILSLIKFFIFPGIFFIFLSSVFIDWYDRKLSALMQDRVGPPLLQPVYDLLKLLVKEDITPDNVDELEFNAIPPIMMIITFLIAFIVPVYSIEGLISFEGDLIFLFFLVTLIGGSIFLLGWSSNNPYCLMGGSRAALADLSFEIPLALSFAGSAILAGSLRLSEITNSDYNLLNLPLDVIRGDLDFTKLIYLLPLLMLFVLSILSVTAVLEKVPFDPAHAEAEIAGGWNVEISGKKLFSTRFANLILEFSLVGIIVAIFLGGPRYPSEIDISGIWTIGNWDVLVYLLGISAFIVKMLLIVFFITLIRASQSRFRIDQLVQYFWRYHLPLTLAAVFIIILILGAGI
jgi:NADH-quinone oxidoreductase subunit H